MIMRNGCDTTRKRQAFLHIAGLLNHELGITPLLFGSLGLEKRLHTDLNADDIDILIPETYLADGWGKLVSLMEADGYALFDAEEHAFRKAEICAAYASIEGLAPFADVDIQQIPMITENGVDYYLLTLPDYLKVYEASAKDGYRKNVKHKQDQNKIDLIKKAITYLSDPCGASSLPFWKTKAVRIPDPLKIIRDDEYRLNKTAYEDCSDEPYFKLVHRMRDWREPMLPDGFRLTDIGIDDFARHIGACYAEGGISETDLREYKNRPVYDPSLWVAVKDELTGKTVASGIAELDTYVGEGVLEWVQVSPEYRHRGLGTFIVNELLRRMKGKADFVTVSGKENNKTNPLALYERCGFSEKVIWHVLVKE